MEVTSEEHPTGRRMPRSCRELDFASGRAAVMSDWIVFGLPVIVRHERERP
jgi:hypothetical protein